MVDPSCSYWVLKDKDEIEEFYSKTLTFRRKAVGWASNQLRNYPSRVKSGEDVFSEARDLMMTDIKSDKIRVKKQLSTTRNFLFNYMRRIIYKYINEEGPLIPQNQCLDDHSFEMLIDLTTQHTQHLSDEEKEIHFQNFLDGFLATLSGLKRDIVSLIISDQNDLYQLLKPVTKGLTDALILELLRSRYIDENGDTGVKFKRDRPPASLKLSNCYKPYRKMIHRILKANRILLSAELIALYLGVSEGDVKKKLRELEEGF